MMKHTILLNPLHGLMFKKTVLSMAALGALWQMPSSALAQFKTGANPTTLATDSNLQVEATGGRQFKVERSTGNVGVGTLSPGNLLEVDSGTTGASGVRLTELANVDVLATNASGDVVAGAATKWCECGDIKTSMQTSDHGAWKIANTGGSFSCASGGSVSAPNMSGAYLRSGVAVGTVAGSNSRTLSLANLPDVSLAITIGDASGGTPSANSVSASSTTETTSSSDGAHSHTNNSGGANGQYGLMRVSNGELTLGAPNDVTAGEPDLYTPPAAVVINSSGGHTHTMNAHSHSASFAASEDLAPHSHSVSLNINNGVEQQALDITPKTLGVNYFICVN